LDDLSNRLDRIIASQWRQAVEQLSWRLSHLDAHNPSHRIRQCRENLINLQHALQNKLEARLFRDRAILRELSAKLTALNPESILARGYSITRTLPGRHIVRNSKSIAIDQEVETVLARGTFESRVKRITDNGKA
jgi:exodeoxyribonuclease VII large subunit